MSKQSDKVKAWRKRTKRRIIDAFGGQCCICGYNKCDSALVLHHINSIEKEFGFGSVIGNGKSWPKIVLELRKCVLVCHNCHTEVHYGNLEIPENVLRFNESFTTYEGYIKTEKKKYLSSCPVCGEDKPICRKTCSLQCAAKLSRRVDWDNVDLVSLLKEKSIVDVADILGCSDAAVHKRMKKIGLK